MTLGVVVSTAAKNVVQVALLPAASVAVTLTLFLYTTLFRSAPAAGDWLKVIAPVAVQLSLTVTPSKTLSTAAWQLAFAPAPGTSEQTTLGGVVSVTAKVVEQVALFPAASVAVTVIVFVPRPTR